MANAGDSRAILCRKGKAVRLTRDHDPEDEAERDRIEGAKGYIRYADNVAVSAGVSGLRKIPRDSSEELVARRDKTGEKCSGLEMGGIFE